jgi:repressor LexA
MFYDKYLSLCTSAGKSPSSVASELGIATGTVSNWKQGGLPRIAQIQKIAEYFNVPAESLFEMRRSVPPQPRYPSNTYEVRTKKIPLLGEIACGEPIYTNEEHDIFLEADSSIHADFALKARGDSMIGAGIFDGYTVLCREQPLVNNGEIAVVIIDNEATLKRFFFDRESNIITLYADNPNYKPIRYVGEEINHVRILGKAVAFYAEIK